MKYLSLLLVSFGILIIACDDPIMIGSDILDQEDVNVTLDTLSITAITVSNDTVISFTENVGNSRYMVGNLDDPIYGTTEATAYFNAELFGAFRDEFSDASLVDSIVMIFVYDTLGQYGADNITHDLELYRVSEPLSNFDEEIDTFFITDEIDIESTPIWSGQKRINHRDSILIRDHIQDTAGLMLPPELRISLDVEEWTDLFASQTDSIDSDLFSQIVPGFALKSSTSNSFIGLDLGANTTVASSSRIFFYYREADDGDRNVYGVPLGIIRHNQTLHDDSGSALETDRQEADPEILYIQPQGGAEIEIDLAAILQEEPFILNRAQIELTVVDPIDEDFRIPDLLNVTFEDENGSEFSVVDFSDISRFGGSAEVVEGEDITRYTLDISSHVNFILDGDVTSTKIKVIPSPRAFVPTRTRVYGPSSSEYPLAVKIIKTNP